MKTESYKDACDKAKEIEKAMVLNRFSYKKKSRIIAVQHCDGSYLEFHSACFKKISDSFMAVYTEHHGMFVYHIEDVRWIREWIKGDYSLPKKYLFYYRENENEEA